MLDHGVVVGVLSDRDLRSGVPEVGKRLGDAAGELLLKQRFGCLPVVTAENVLVGIVTSSDFIKLVVKATRDR